MSKRFTVTLEEDEFGELTFPYFDLLAVLGILYLFKQKNK